MNAQEARDKAQEAIEKKHKKVFDAIDAAANAGRFKVQIPDATMHHEEELVRFLKESGYRVYTEPFMYGFWVSW